MEPWICECPDEEHGLLGCDLEIDGDGILCPPCGAGNCEDV